MPHGVTTILAPGANPFEFAVACEVFGLRRPELGPPLYEHRLAAASRPVEADGGWLIETPHGLETLEWVQTIVVPAGPAHPDDVPDKLIDALREAYDRGTRIVPFCSGAFILAAAGILDGRPATTHWLYVEVTDLTVDTIADRVGFGNATNLREHFRRVVGTTPPAYRQRFRRQAS